MTRVKRKTPVRQASTPEGTVAEGTVKEYNEFISGVQLQLIELAEVRARAETSDLSDLALRVGSKFTITSPKQDDSRFTVEASLQLDFHAEDEGSLGEFSCLYRLEYTTEVPLTDPVFKVFSERNVPLNIWPFLRELVMSTTQRFGWSGFVLPAYKVPTFSPPAVSATDVSVKSARPRVATRKSAAAKPAKE